MTIQDIMIQRNIRHLMHFTRTENLRSILCNGLIPREYLYGSGAVFNDLYRYDRCENAVCTTIEFPNYRMFFSLRQNDPDSAWAVLQISADILMEFDCAFCQTNAGSEASYTTPLEDRMGAVALASLYAPVARGVKRSPFIPPAYPTDPQAEVLVFGTIPPAYIQAVYFHDLETLRLFGDLQGAVPLTINRGLFSYRTDFKQWQAAT